MHRVLRERAWTWRWLLLVPLVATGVTHPASAESGWSEQRRDLRPGVIHIEMRRQSPDLVVNVARVASGADVQVRPVLAYDRVGDHDPARPREATSAMCARAGGVVCVNADFFACASCREPFGGVVQDERVLRSFSPIHEQFSVTAGGFSLTRPGWSGVVRAVYTWHGAPAGLAPRTETRDVPLSALNGAPVPDASVLFTPDWGEETPSVEGRNELVLRTSEAVRPGAIVAEIIGQRPAGGQLDHRAVTVSTGGAATEAMSRFLHEWHASDADEKRLTIETAIDGGVRQSVGGHPVLMRDGVRAQLDPKDSKVSLRHPRTLLGWTSDRELLLVTVDGRQRGRSDGVTLPEAVELLERLGAVSAINLDGGGSSTFVGPCTTGQCVLNRPSDGSERRVPVALAIVAPERPGPIPHFASKAPVLAPKPAVTAPPVTAPAPVTPVPAPAPKPAPATPAPETAVPAAPAVEAEVAPPAPPTDDAVPPAVPPAVATVTSETAARVPSDQRPRPSSPAAAVTVAALALLGSASWTVVTLRRRRR